MLLTSKLLHLCNHPKHMTYTHTHSHDHDMSHHNHDTLVDGLIDHGQIDYITNHSGFLNDGDIDVYVDPSLHPKVKHFAERLVRRVNEITETDIIINNNKSESDVLLHEVENYNDRPGFEEALGLQYWENGKSNATWTEEVGEPSYNRKGKARVSRFTKYVISHEFFHSLGLGHPFGLGVHPKFNSDDTVMSYNQGNLGGFRGYPMTHTDLEALAQIW